MSRKLAPSRSRRDRLAALLAACGSNSQAGTATGNSTNANLQKAVQFSGCMRGERRQGLPGPRRVGQLTIDQVANGSGLDHQQPSLPAGAQRL